MDLSFDRCHSRGRFAGVEFRSEDKTALTHVTRKRIHRQSVFVWSWSAAHRLMHTLDTSKKRIRGTAVKFCIPIIASIRNPRCVESPLP